MPIVEPSGRDARFLQMEESLGETTRTSRGSSRGQMQPMDRDGGS